LKDETKLQVNTEYLYRQEYEDAFVVYNMKDDIYFMINKAYYDFVSELKKYDTIFFSDLQKKYNVTADNKAFIIVKTENTLFQNKMYTFNFFFIQHALK
jgi:hypothetical protein